MDNHAARFDHVFFALADPTRRAIVGQLVQGVASVSELKAPFAMSLPSFMKHLRVLERAGLLRSRKRGRTRTCMLEPAALRDTELWLMALRRQWEARRTPASV